MGVNSLPNTVTRQRRGCDLNPGPSAPESSTLTTRLPSHRRLTYDAEYRLVLCGTACSKQVFVRVFRCTVASVQKRHVAIARLRHPAVLGRTCQEVWFIILVVTSTKEVSFPHFLHSNTAFYSCETMLSITSRTSTRTGSFSFFFHHCNTPAADALCFRSVRRLWVRACVLACPGWGILRPVYRRLLVSVCGFSG